MLSQDAPPSYKGKTDPNSEEHAMFFRQLLGDVDTATAPFGMLERQGDGVGMEEAELEVDSALASRLRTTTRAFAVSAASLCHLAWAQVLAKTSGQEDVVFGTVLYTRKQGATEEDAYRLFPTTLPVRISIGEESAENSLKRVRELLTDLLRHKYASLGLAQRCSAVPVSTPLFSSLFRYRRGQSSQEVYRIAAGVSDVVQNGCVDERTGYPFVLSVDDLGDQLKFVAQAPASIGALRICQFMHTALASLIEALESAPATPVSMLNILPEAERNQVLFGWNDTHIDFPSHKCVHELFEEQVRANPDAIAIVHEENKLSYAELNARANRLAHYLRNLGVKPDVRVAICVERGFEMIVGMLAILKAGGAYVPLDPAYPVERLLFMLEDSAPLALLTLSHLAGLFSGVDKTPRTLHLDAVNAPWQNSSDSNPSPGAVGLSPNHLAYVIYTSGSTGKPKGVLCEHRGLCNLALAQIEDFAVESDSRVLQFASFSFDACVSEVMTTLCQGAALYFGPRGKLLVGETLGEVVAQYRITHATLPPAVLNGVAEEADFGTLRTLALAGEALSDLLASRWARGRRLINAYGPTESTVCATSYHYRPGRSGAPPIGRPLANAKVYILDERKEPVPIGVAGELYIGGIGVARGYLNRAELTATRFLLDPFAPESKARMYRTGDLGRWLPDGNIEFLGRNDFQVKIRGFRIELGEIEARLAEYPGVREAVVIAREDTPGEKRLFAYYTVADGHAAAKDLPNAENLRMHVSARLPEYMAPAAYVRLESLPLTVNGKLDRKALPIPSGDAYASSQYEAPAGEVELALAEIWTELLRVDRVGRRDNFFSLGGHSLLAVKMIAKVRAAFGTRLALFSFIQTPTIEYLAHLLSGNAIAHMAVVNKGAPDAIPLIWVAPDPWQPRLASYLSANQPVLSFVLSQEELASTAPYYRLEDLAAHIVKKLRQLYPRPAYVLAGFCQTSLLAYECAQQLRQLGHEVPLLVMGDAILPGYIQRLPFYKRSRRRLEREMFYLSAFRHSSPSQWRQLVRQRLGGLRAIREQRMFERFYRSSETDGRSVQELYQALIVSHFSYIPAPYPGRVLYLQSAERPQSELWDTAGSWQDLIEEMEVFEAPGDHTSIFQEPHVRVTAQRLQQALDRIVEDAIFTPTALRGAAISMQL
jgi:amino acid adenylation domain-containing protein